MICIFCLFSFYCISVFFFPGYLYSFSIALVFLMLCPACTICDLSLSTSQHCLGDFGRFLGFHKLPNITFNNHTNAFSLSTLFWNYALCFAIPVLA